MNNLESLHTREGFYEYVISEEGTDRYNDEDLQFIESIRNILAKKYSNPGFGILQLSIELSLSYLQLFRKLKRITNKSAKTILQEYRMLCALELLKDDSIPLGEIAEKVGFNSQSNFNVYFKKFFGCTPSELQKLQTVSLEKTANYPDSLKLVITNNKYNNYSVKEKQLFDQLFQEIWKNLNNENYSAKQASLNLFISYSQLNRKLMRLCSFSIGQLILMLRLEHAANLLENNQMKVKEIAYNVGFKESSHFSKAFKKRFKRTPNKYRKEKIIAKNIK